MLQDVKFTISPETENRLLCEDFVEKKPRKFHPIETLKKKRLFRRLFRRDK